MVNSDYIEYIDSHINEIKEKYTSYNTMKDYDVFSFLCMKYFFFNEDDTPFDADVALEYFTDGANDGGIDAIFNDPNSDDNDVIVMQCKHYRKSILRPEEIGAAVLKIKNTLLDLKTNRTEMFNERLVDAYRDSLGNMNDNGNIKIYFFTMYQPKNKRIANSIKRQFQNFPYDVELIYGKDIEDQIEICDNGKTCVDSDKLMIDDKNNILHYADSIIVNISAKSLSELYVKRKNGLLGMNLRYYVRQKNVDLGIQQTISKNPNYFWYKNNGIVIFCEDYYIDGNELKLKNFSIINGGQTTNQLGKLEIKEDFYLLCKVIKAPEGENDSGQFAFSIAEATNSQKPIKPADLKANTPEQLNLRKRLRKEHVWYITKKGDRATKDFNKHYEVARIDKVGKISLAGILQMPGTARNSATRKMYGGDFYWKIYGPDAREGVIADLLKINYYYERFKAVELKKEEYSPHKGVFKNCQTFQLALITFMSKLVNNVFSQDNINQAINNIELLKSLLYDMGTMTHIIGNKKISETEEKATLYNIFNILGAEVLAFCYSDEVYKQRKMGNENINPSNYFKKDTVYYESILPRLLWIYNQNQQLQSLIKKICLKEK